MTGEERTTPRMSRIEDHFDEEAAVYDEVILSIIPGYVEQNDVLLDSLSLPLSASRVADLGIGTGQLSDLVLDRFASATVVGYDLSQRMLDEARTNLSRFGDRVELVRADLASIALEGAFDAVIAGLSVHHLDDGEKRELFGRVHDALRPGGGFVLRDVVLGDTDEENERMGEKWADFIRSNGLDATEVLRAHHAEDKPAPLSSQLEWLREAGFTDVRVVWHETMFAIFGGTKPQE